MLILTAFYWSTRRWSDSTSRTRVRQCSDSKATLPPHHICFWLKSMKKSSYGSLGSNPPARTPSASNSGSLRLVTNQHSPGAPVLVACAQEDSQALDLRSALPLPLAPASWCGHVSGQWASFRPVRLWPSSREGWWHLPHRVQPSSNETLLVNPSGSRPGTQQSYIECWGISYQGSPYCNTLNPLS